MRESVMQAKAANGGIEMTSQRCAVARTIERRRRAVALAACCVVIAAVSVHDATLVVLNEDMIIEFERNPVGKWLIERQGGEVWLFVLAKFAGAAVVCATLITLYRRRRGMALAAAGVLAAFQLALLGYLLFA
jgi:hypothetical protein